MANLNKNHKKSLDQITFCHESVLNWFDQSMRKLPWRYLSNQRVNPYHVWLSEIMLQQTMVKAVIPYFNKFIEQWPAVDDLANASQDDVMYAWAGLGYYSRARNLLSAARQVAFDYDGVFPSQQKDLLTLPGVGDYTSAAIAAIAFKQPVTVIDGNIERIFTRLFAFKDELPKHKKDLKHLIDPYFQRDNFDRIGDFAQALMDLGAGVCTAKSPKCDLCPMSSACKAYELDEVIEYPVKAKKKKRPFKKAYAYWIENDAGQLLLERRPEKGILAETLGFICSEWLIGDDIVHVDFLDNIRTKKRTIKHVFTHFDLELTICYAKLKKHNHIKNSWRWYDAGSELQQGLPTLFNKVYTAAEESV